LALGITELILQLSDVIVLSCYFESSPLFSNIDFFSKKQICFDYNNLEFDTSQPFKQNKHSQYFEYITINSDGFRGSEIIKKSPNEFRIFILGGSTTFGIVSTSDKTTISAYLENFFHIDEFDFVKVINAGVPGANSRDEYFYLKTKLIEYDPDLIIMYDGWNDITSRTTFMHLSDDEYTTKPQSETIQINKTEKSGTGILKFFEIINYKTGIKSGAWVKSLYVIEEYGKDSERINTFSKKIGWMHVH
jgi:lysophospholipase L1-like esterase